MTTDAFINALRCFTAIRGPIQQLRSDQGSNFVGARNELSKAMKELDNDKIQSFDNQSLRNRYECSLFQSLEGKETMVKGPVSGRTSLEKGAKGVLHQREFKTRMVSAKEKSENR